MKSNYFCFSHKHYSNNSLFNIKIKWELQISILKLVYTGYDKKFHKMTKNLTIIKLTKNVTENCYASYN